MQKSRRNPAFFYFYMISSGFICSREALLTIWLNLFNKKKRRCDNLEIVITVTAGMGFLFSFYLFYFYPVISESKGKPLSERQTYMMRGLAVIVLLASAIRGSHFA
ncbi:hypothetical protein FA002_12980 [Priestia megaterium]|uniref:hypothetical protein n=1 Tax=Priestia megaterium TaxID=1404 RepID=UPI0010AC2D7F|nr:hypothetical protein [Priestia megaterium]TJZ36710.1 hypothetical protein FA002_12980 [Priestia megaterium]